MWTWKKNKTKDTRLKEYDRLMLRSSFVSLFWTAITERRRREKFTLQAIADYVGTNKSVVSRWFSNSHPNWEIDSIADIAGALNLDLMIQAVDRQSKAVFTAAGLQTPTTIEYIRTEPTADVATRPIISRLPNGATVEARADAA